MRTLVKNKIFNFLHQKDVILVKGMVQSLDTIQIDVLTAGETEELELIKVFLQFSKLVLSVLVVVKKLLILVMIVMGREINKLQKKYLLLYLKV